MRALVLADPGYATAWHERAVRVAEDLASLAEFVQSQREADKLAAARGAFEQYRTLVAAEQDLLRLGARAHAPPPPPTHARTRGPQGPENPRRVIVAPPPRPPRPPGPRRPPH